MSERRTKTTWTDEEDARLTRLYAEGLTFVQIAERLGYSKSKVAGRLHRLNLTGKRPMGRHRQAVHSVKPGPKPKAPVGAARGRPAREKLPLPQEPKRLPKPVLVRQGRPSDLIWAPRTCQFPIGEPKSPGFHFCGAKLEPADGRPYCPEHHARCYLPPKKKEGDGPAGEFKMFGWGGKAA